jgi:hypothetical protein
MALTTVCTFVLWMGRQMLVFEKSSITCTVWSGSLVALAKGTRQPKIYIL